VTSADQPPSRPHDPLIGRVFNDRFKVERLIARGGSSAVYCARQAPLGRTCALKVLQPRYEGAVQSEFHRRFFLEASIASKLTHPNNVTVFDYGHTNDGVYFMAMELLEGRTLAQAIKAEAPFYEERILHIARQIARALREAHGLGVIHRDIKPSNVFLLEHGDEDDFVKVIDYGLVKDVGGADGGEDITQAGLFMGSPKYVAPEQIQGYAVDGRTDIYSLGIVLYEMAVGRVPFDRGSDVQTLIAHVKDPPPPLRSAFAGCKVSPLLEEVIFRCIAKDPAQRFGSVDELLQKLKQGSDAVLTATIQGESGRLVSLPPSGIGKATDVRTGTVSGPHVFLAGATGPSTPIDPAVLAREQSALRRSRRVRTAMAAGVVAATVAATAALFALRSRNSADLGSVGPMSASSFADSHPPVRSMAAPVGASAAPASSETHAVRIDTEPPGATVRLGGPQGRRLCEATPCEVALGHDGLGDRVRVHIARAGFVATTADVGKSDSALTVRLVPVAEAAPRKKTPASPDPGWYKMDPY